MVSDQNGDDSRTQIVYFINSLHTGGAEMGMCRLLYGLDSAQYDVTVIALDGHSEEILDRIPSWVRVIDLRLRSKPNVTSMVDGLSSIRSADVIVGSLYHSVLVARLSGMLNRSATVVTWQHRENFKTDLRRKLIGLTNFLSDRVIADSEPVAEMYRREFRLDSEFVRTVPIAGIQLDSFPVKKHRPKETVIVGSVGRLIPPKNYATLVKIAEKLSEPNIEFRIAGDGPERHNLEKIIEQKDLDNVELVGEIQDVAGFLSTLDIYIQPSRSEGLCMTVIEAMAAGLPVVGSDVGGIGWYVRDGSSGFLHNPNDVDGFISSIESLSSNEILRRKFGERGRETVENLFTQDLLVTNFENAIYE